MWTGGEEGKGRQLTAAEAEWGRKRLLSGGSMRASDARNVASRFGIALGDDGRPVGQGGGQDEADAAAAAATQAAATQAAPADAGLDGKNGRIGIGARIVDSETGKSRSSLSMNGPALKPRRRIGDMGPRSLTDTKRLI